MCSIFFFKSFLGFLFANTINDPNICGMHARISCQHDSSMYILPFDLFDFLLKFQHKFFVLPRKMLQVLFSNFGSTFLHLLVNLANYIFLLQYLSLLFLAYYLLMKLTNLPFQSFSFHAQWIVLYDRTVNLIFLQYSVIVNDTQNACWFLDPNMAFINETLKHLIVFFDQNSTQSWLSDYINQLLII